MYTSAAVYNNTAACLFEMTHRKMRINSISHSSNKQNITKRFLVSFMRGMNNVFGLNDSTCSMRKIQFCHAFELNSICKYVLFDVHNLNNTRRLEALRYIRIGETKTIFFFAFWKDKTDFDLFVIIEVKFSCLSDEFKLRRKSERHCLCSTLQAATRKARFTSANNLIRYWW